MFPSSHSDGRHSVTVILNLFKRNYVQEQLQAIYGQSCQPESVWVIQMGNHLSLQSIRHEFPDVRVIQSEVDIKYFGRFSLARYASTEFIWIIDDDIIPSSSWLRTCVEKCARYNSIICCNGRIIPRGDFTPEVPKECGYLGKYFIGDSKGENFNFHDKDAFVDYPCSSYFLRTSWLDHFWAIKPYRLDMGEDIHLAAACMLKGNISTLVPQQLSFTDSGNIKPMYSIDAFASWKKPDFINKRSEVFNYLINQRKWSPLLWQ
jgi:hypothetical protein